VAAPSSAATARPARHARPTALSAWLSASPKTYVMRAVSVAPRQVLLLLGCTALGLRSYAERSIGKHL
jgi:hypothetical protein